MTILTTRRSEETYRPRLHFSPPNGWMNDPNGLIYHDGLWHMFYQYNPYGIVPGDMHWGHAVSTDLVNWTDKDVALAPDEMGSIFSGTALSDPNGRTGLFDGGSGGGLVVFYTVSENRADQVLQAQCLATSVDGGETWVKSASNPILTALTSSCFRDPCVYWHEQSNHWIMAVSHGCGIGLYCATDMYDWSLMSEFISLSYKSPDIVYECPDFFPMVADDGVEKWVMIISINNKHEPSGTATRYFIGDFDGTYFTVDDEFESGHWLDIGRDCYAAQTWRGAPDGMRTVIAWMSNWQYARQAPTQKFRGAMTLPRHLQLHRVGVSYQLSQHLPESVIAVLSTGETSVADSDGRVPINSSLYRLTGRLSLKDGKSAGIRLFGESEDQFTIRRIEDGVLVVTSRRSNSVNAGILPPGFTHSYDSVVDKPAGDFNVELVCDRGAVELFLANGRGVLSNNFFPDILTADIILTGEGWQDVQVTSIPQYSS